MDTVVGVVISYMSQRVVVSFVPQSFTLAEEMHRHLDFDVRWTQKITTIKRTGNIRLTHIPLLRHTAPS
jgi:hypothetical protein